MNRVLEKTTNVLLQEGKKKCREKNNVAIIVQPYEMAPPVGKTLRVSESFCRWWCYLGFRKRYVHDVRVSSWLSVLQTGVNHLISSDLAVLFPRERRLPGHTDGRRVYSLDLQLTRRSSGHWG